MKYHIEIGTGNKAKQDIDEICRREGFVNLTRRFFAIEEESILRHQPAFYLWTHNRRRRGREEFYRKYDAIDGKIIRKEEYK